MSPFGMLLMLTSLPILVARLRNDKKILEELLIENLQSVFVEIEVAYRQAREKEHTAYLDDVIMGETMENTFHQVHNKLTVFVQHLEAMLVRRVDLQAIEEILERDAVRACVLLHQRANGRADRGEEEKGHFVLLAVLEQMAFVEQDA